MSNGAAIAAAAAAAIANAIKASGTIVQVDSKDFMAILAKSKTPLVVQSQGGVFTTRYSYLTSYKGLAFYTKVKTPLNLPGDIELVAAKKIWMPD
jgi:hypothetical protein